ncbi:ATP-binding protein [Picosynechococcus sp. NKBG15041c]|uniref:ATP-binding protein n=1 Tax=Picosynechococcus sp. NKBG15041c TaxID=1407650 RepID=UPI0004021C42|nr:ATP-binding protein [Picosynechococcus sp. NKBG15041c]
MCPVHPHHQLIRNIQAAIDTTQDLAALFPRAIADLQAAFAVDEATIGLIKSTHPLRQRREQIATATLELQLPSEQLPCRWALQDCDFCQAAWHQAPEIWMLSPGQAQREGRSPLSLAQYHQILLAPLMGGQRLLNQEQTVLGFIMLMGRSPGVWLPEDLSTLAIIAHQLGQTIIHRQTLRQIQALVEERTRQLQWSLEVQGKLSKKMRQQIQQLRQLNRLKDDFLSTVSHELNTPLATMKLAVKMLKQPGRSPEKQQTYLDILDEELNRESKLIHDLLQLQQAEASTFALKPQRLNLIPALNTLAEKFQARWFPLKQLQLQLSLKPTTLGANLQLETDPEHFLNAISELLTNAGKYATPNSIVQLEVQYFRRSPAHIQIRICNDGIKIEGAEQGQIFEKFQRGEAATQRAIPGTGLGLTLVKTIVEHLEGTITVSSAPNPDREDYHTCFSLVFPQAIASI